MERKFFVIVRLFVLAAAALSLLCAVGAAGYGLTMMNASGGGKVASPTVTFDAFKNDAQKKSAASDAAAKQAEEALLQKKTEAGRDPDAIPAQFLDELNRIEKSISNYAEKTGQAAPVSTFRAAVYRHSVVFARQGFQEAFLKQLADECATMERNADAAAKLPPDDPARPFWANFLTYYFESYKDSLAKQAQAISQSESEAIRKRLGASSYLYFAAAAFVNFITLVIMLVLFGIESNTYAMRKALEKTSS